MGLSINPANLRLLGKGQIATEPHPSSVRGFSAPVGAKSPQPELCWLLVCRRMEGTEELSAAGRAQDSLARQRPGPHPSAPDLAVAQRVKRPASCCCCSCPLLLWPLLPLPMLMFDADACAPCAPQAEAQRVWEAASPDLSGEDAWIPPARMGSEHAVWKILSKSDIYGQGGPAVPERAAARCASRRWYESTGLALPLHGQRGSESVYVESE